MAKRSAKTAAKDDAALDTVTIPRVELLQVADAVAREKGIEREQVLEAMELAIQKAGRSKYGHEHDIRAAIDRSNGSVKLARFGPDFLEVLRTDAETTAPR